MNKKINAEATELFSLRKIEKSEGRSFREHNAVEILEGRGLVDTKAAVDQIVKWPTGKVEELCIDLFDFLENQRSTWDGPESSQITPFNCLAGSSIRGDSGCAALDCRAAKLDSLARYAATYAEPDVPTSYVAKSEAYGEQASSPGEPGSDGLFCA